MLFTTEEHLAQKLLLRRVYHYTNTSSNSVRRSRNGDHDAR